MLPTLLNLHVFITCMLLAFVCVCVCAGGVSALFLANGLWLTFAASCPSAIILGQVDTKTHRHALVVHLSFMKVQKSQILHLTHQVQQKHEFDI
jgi:hypothetical protein